jgi:hypothetical protein
VSGFHRTDCHSPTAPETDGSAATDEDAESTDIADAMGSPEGAQESERRSRNYCVACGDPTKSSALSWLAVHDDSGASHTAICQDCANDAAAPPACAICRVTDGETYAVTYVSNGEQFGTVCAACRTGLCEGVNEGN